MFIDFDDYRPDTPHLERAISLREGIMLSIIGHLLLTVLFLLGPRVPFIAALLQPSPEEVAARQAELERLRQQQEQPRFVFVQPKVDMRAIAPPPRAEMSDQDRVAQALERAPDPTNPLPFSRGNTTERVDSEKSPAEKARGEGPSPDPSEATSADTGGQDSDQRTAFLSERGRPVAPDAQDASRGATPGGSLGQALKNLQKYVDDQRFNNPTGQGGAFGPAIQFDTKGVEFGPWIRRFVAQVKRNWFIPYAAMSFRGHVVVTFNVHRDGRITDVTIVGPSSVESFNSAAFNAILGSNPTQALPPEYPSDTAFFTVTFYYNEQPSQ